MADESKKAVLSLILVVSGFGAAFVLADPHFSLTTKIVWPSIAIVSGVVLSYLMTRRDRYDDHLAEVSKSYFDAWGLAFHVVPQINSAGDYCWSIFYQNQYDSPCVAELELFAAKGMRSLKKRTGRRGYRIPIKAGPAEFGVVRLKVGFTEAEAGHSVMLKYGARVKRPLGKGAKVRFRDGMTIKKKPGRVRAGRGGCLFSLLLLPAGLLFIKGHGPHTKFNLPSSTARSASAKSEGTYVASILWTPPSTDTRRVEEDVYAVVAT